MCFETQNFVSQSTFNNRYGEINYIDSAIFSSNNCLSLVLNDSIIFATYEQRFPTANAEIGIVGIDFQGNELFSKLYGSQEAWWLLGNASSSFIDSEGNILETGSIDDSGSILYLPQIYKFDFNGDTIWTKRLEIFDNRPAYGEQIIEVSNGDLIVTIRAFTDTIDWNPQVVVVRTDSEGNIIWMNEYGDPTSSAEYGVSIIEMGDGNFLIGGAFQQTPNSDSDNFLIKIDANGNEIWNKTFGSPSFDDGTVQLLALSDDNYLMSGAYGVNDEFSSNPFTSNLRKIDPDGEIIWEFQFGDSSEVSGFYSSIEDWQHNIVSVGETIDSFGWRSGTMMKSSLSGDSIWMRQYSLFDNSVVHQLRDVAMASDSSYIAAGYVLVVPPNPHVGQDVWVFKVDQHGCLEPGCHLIDGLQSINIGLENTMDIYPNPVTDYLNVNFNLPPSGSFGDQKNSRLLLINQVGKTVLEKSLQAFKNQQSFEVKLNLQEMNSGIYTLHWLSDKGWLDSIKLLKLN